MKIIDIFNKTTHYCYALLQCEECGDTRCVSLIYDLEKFKTDELPYVKCVGCKRSSEDLKNKEDMRNENNNL